MDFALTDEQVAQKQQYTQVCQELARHRPKQYLGWETIYTDDECWEFNCLCAKEFGKRGWLSLSWPSEYGGSGTMMDRVLFSEVRGYHNIPGVDMFGVGMLAPTLLQTANDEIKRKFLPPISTGEVAWCELWSEPDAGSDLVSLKSTAIKQADEYVINGQKIWTTGAHRADWAFGVFKTDLEAPAHHSLTFLLLDMKTPGITIRPINYMHGERIYNEVFLDDVRVPVENVVGQENEGWKVVNTLASFERSHIEEITAMSRELEELVAYCNETKLNGRPLSHDPLVRNRLAEIACDLRACRALAYRVADLQNRNEMSLMNASALKIMASELGERFAAVATDILGPYGQVKASKWSPLRGLWERKYQECFVFSIAAGTNEIQKNIISWHGLGLPRMR